MKVTLVNHACVLYENNSVRLLTDPWMSGSVFDDGWDHLVPYENPTSIEDYDPTHLWISHEHPDHFSPHDLSAVPCESRSRFPVFYQATVDAKVLTFLREAQFDVRELEHGIPVDIADDFRIKCDSVFEDSWLHIETPGFKVLNFNDCYVAENQGEVIQAVADTAGPIDVLMTQFSFANWVGNPDDETLQIFAAQRHLKYLKLQIQTLKPRFVIPFAAFVNFSHEENQYLNRFGNTVDLAAQAIQDAGAIPVVLYPGDTWDTSVSWDNTSSLKKWREVYKYMPEAQHCPVGVSKEQLTKVFGQYVGRLRIKNDTDALRDIIACIEPAHIYLWDHGAVRFDLNEGLTFVDREELQCDISMSSSSLEHVMMFEWGRGTLSVNGRFTVRYATVHRFFQQTHIAYANNVGKMYPDTLTREEVLTPSSYVSWIAEHRARNELPDIADEEG